MLDPSGFASTLADAVEAVGVNLRRLKPDEVTAAWDLGEAVVDRGYLLPRRRDSRRLERHRITRGRRRVAHLVTLEVADE